MTKRNGNFNFCWSIVLVQPFYCACFSQGQSVNKLWKHKGTKKHLFCTMQSLCIPSLMTTNPLLLLQMWPVGCYGKIAMVTGPQEALVGMQKTFSVFVWSSCIQPSDFGFEIIKLNQRKLWLFCFRNFWIFPAPEHQHGGWCDLPGKDQSFSQNEWIALRFLKGEVWIMWCLNLSLWLHALVFFYNLS